MKRFTFTSNINLTYIPLGLGDYKLLKQFNMLACSPDEVCLLKCHSPQEVVDILQDRNIHGTLKSSNV